MGVVSRVKMVYIFILYPFNLHDDRDRKDSSKRIMEKTFRITNDSRCSGCTE